MTLATTLVTTGPGPALGGGVGVAELVGGGVISTALGALSASVTAACVGAGLDGGLAVDGAVGFAVMWVARMLTG